MGSPEQNTAAREVPGVLPVVWRLLSPKMRDIDSPRLLVLANAIEIGRLSKTQVKEFLAVPGQKKFVALDTSTIRVFLDRNGKLWAELMTISCQEAIMWLELDGIVGLGDRIRLVTIGIMVKLRDKARTRADSLDRSIAEFAKS